VEEHSTSKLGLLGNRRIGPLDVRTDDALLRENRDESALPRVHLSLDKQRLRMSVDLHTRPCTTARPDPLRAEVTCARCRISRVAVSRAPDQTYHEQQPVTAVEVITMDDV
jgi:hypothetical protein